MDNQTTKNQNNELLAKIEERKFNMMSTHNTAYFTFLGFIISMLSVLIGFKENLGMYQKVLLIISIISLLSGCWLYFSDSKIAIKLISNIYQVVAKHTDNQTHPYEDLDQISELSKTKMYLGMVSGYLMDFGILVFLISLITFLF